MKLKHLLAPIAVALTAMLALSGCGNARAVDTRSYVLVPGGSTFETLLDSLGADGEKIISIDAFVRSAKMAGLDQKVTPGRYQLREGMTYNEVARMFRQGLQKPARVTFNSIRTLDRLAGALSKQLEADSVTIYSYLSADTMAAKYGFDERTFIAMFIPNTYEVYWTTSPDRFIARMKGEYDKFWTDERRAKLEKAGLTQLEASILASIVYQETKMSDEMPTVAGVYINRLRIGMPLQADPTVKFAVGDPTIKRVLNRHLEVDSPYNTYLHRGLPPGPICMPSIKAIDAVLNYREHKYMYFCAKPDFSGYHNFAVTLAEHNRNAREYARFLNRQRIMR